MIKPKKLYRHRFVGQRKNKNVVIHFLVIGQKRKKGLASHSELRKISGSLYPGIKLGPRLERRIVVVKPKKAKGGVSPLLNRGSAGLM